MSETTIQGDGLLLMTSIADISCSARCSWFLGPPLASRTSVPASRDLSERGRIQVVELVTAVPSGRHQSGPLEHLEMLGNGLSRQADPMLHRQTGAQLEQRLPIPFVQLVEDCSPSRCRKRLVDVAHPFMICKSRLACQDSASPDRQHLEPALAREVSPIRGRQANAPRAVMRTMERGVPVSWRTCGRATYGAGVWQEGVTIPQPRRPRAAGPQPRSGDEPGVGAWLKSASESGSFRRPELWIGSDGSTFQSAKLAPA